MQMCRQIIDEFPLGKISVKYIIISVLVVNTTNVALHGSLLNVGLLINDYNK